jgi:hypothetical protein
MSLFVKQKSVLFVAGKIDAAPGLISLSERVL